MMLMKINAVRAAYFSSTSIDGLLQAKSPLILSFLYSLLSFVFVMTMIMISIMMVMIMENFNFD